MGLKEKIDGNEPSYVWPEDDIIGYTTNYGGVDLKISTGEVDFACMSIDRDGHNKWMAVKITGEEFAVWENRLGGQITADLHSSKYPYQKGNNSLPPAEVFRSLKADENYSIAGVAVKKTLVRLMKKHLILSKEDKQELQELFKIWRKPITTKTVRKSIRRD